MKSNNILRNKDTRIKQEIILVIFRLYAKYKLYACVKIRKRFLGW